MHMRYSNQWVGLESIQIVSHFHSMQTQGAFHVANPEDLRRRVRMLLGVAAYDLLSWRNLILSSTAAGGAVGVLTTLHQSHRCFNILLLLHI